MKCRELAELLMQTPDMEAVVAAGACGDEYRPVSAAVATNLYYEPGHPDWMKDYKRDYFWTRTVRLLER